MRLSFILVTMCSQDNSLGEGDGFITLATLLLSVSDTRDYRNVSTLYSDFAILIC